MNKRDRMTRSHRMMLIVTVCLLAVFSGSATQGEAIEELPVVATLTGQGWDRVTNANAWDRYVYLNTLTDIDHGNGIVIVDVRDPLNPTEVAYYDGYYYGQATTFSGNHMYLSMRYPGYEGPENGLRVIDVSNPADPVLVGTFSTIKYPTSIEVYGDHAYVLTRGGGLFVLDVSDPMNPTEVAWIGYSGDALILIPPPDGGEPGAGPILYVSIWGEYGGLIALSILDPTAPYKIDSTASYNSYAICSVGSVIVTLRYAGGGQLVLLDGTRPFEELGVYAFGWEVGTLELRAGAGDRHVYTCWGGSIGDYHVVDISTPSAPAEVAHCETGVAYPVIAPAAWYVYVIGSNPVASPPSSYATVGASDTTDDPKSLIVTEALRVLADVTWDSWAAVEIDACVGADIVGGYPDGSYQPEAVVTRDQMAVYIARAMAGGDANVPGSAAYPVPSFADVPETNWAYRYVEYASAQVVVGGYGDGTYQPTRQVDRGQMAVYVARARGWVGIADDMTTAPELFPDVPAGFWAGTAVQTCVANEVVQGYDDGYYYPANTVTRDQMAVYVARGFGL